MTARPLTPAEWRTVAQRAQDKAFKGAPGKRLARLDYGQRVKAYADRLESEARDETVLAALMENTPAGGAA